MTEKRFEKLINEVGLRCFVQYFNEFSSEMSNTEVVELLQHENPFTEKSCITRTRYARSIIRQGLAEHALKRIAQADPSKVDRNIRNEAERLLRGLESV